VDQAGVERARRPNPPAIRLVLADDHALVLEGLRVLLSAEPDLRVLATASDGERALEAVRRFLPDVAVLDVHMPYLDGLACLRQIRAANLPVRVVLLTGSDADQVLRAAMEAGADGLALKADPPAMLFAAIRHVAAGHLTFPQSVRRWLIAPAPEPGPDELTERETEVWARLAQGKSNALIAAELSLSESTVKFHLRNLFAKLGVANRNEATARYHQRGGNSPPPE
jgi:DNA-binding NarL/FixJ family response regulator